MSTPIAVPVAPPTEPPVLTLAVGDEAAEAIDAASPGAFDAVAASLHRVAASIEGVIPRQIEAARNIRLGKLAEAFPIISECFATWQGVQNALGEAAQAIRQPVENLAELLLTPNHGAATEDSSISAPSAPLTVLATLLHDVRQTVLARDWVGLADALEYDLSDLAQRWHSALLFSDEAEPAPSAGRIGVRESSGTSPNV